VNKIGYIVLFLIGLSSFAHPATRGDIKVIESSENIRYISQKIVTDYLYFYHNPQKLEIKDDLSLSLEKLNEDLRVIAMTTKDSDTKDLLEFLAYSKDDIEQIFHRVPNKENAELMLDYGEILREGADSIAQAHLYDFTKEEKMLMINKEVEFLLERAIKYYMGLNVGFNNPVNKEKMLEAITQIEVNLKQINLYTYPDEMIETHNNLNQFWKENKIFLNKTEKLHIPSLMRTSISYLEDIVANLVIYHSKNQ